MSFTRRGRGSGYPLTAADHAELFERYRAGQNPTEIARGFGCSPTTVYSVFGKPLFAQRRVERSRRHLSLAERETISRGLVAGDCPAAIGRELGRPTSTVTRELDRNGGTESYRAVRAHRRALECSVRPKQSKLSRSPRLLAEVERGLGQGWSPQQISARLKRDHPDEPEMRISHETIYQSIYVQGRGELRRELAKCLRSGRAKRRPRGGRPRAPQIPGMVMISERPAEVEDRAVPGHWEGDLIVGAKGRSFIATLVERQTRFVMLARLGETRTSEQVVEALKARIGQLPEHLKLSLTWDQGKEMAGHQSFSLATEVDVYFCDPHSPWQRGSNENTNGLLRQYLPKGSDLAARSQVELDQIAAELNGRPRQTLEWMTPAEKMEELLR